MEEGQKQFYRYMMERVREENKEQVKQMLQESFQRQANGTFTKEYLDSFNSTVLTLLKQDFIEEVRTVLTQFGAAHTSGS